MGFLLDMLTDAIRERQVAKTNNGRRGVTEYCPSQIAGFVEQDAYTCNVLGSGGTDELRSEVITALCIAAANANMPTVILHQGDTAMQRTMRAVFRGYPEYMEIGRGARHFDPFYQINSDKIGKLIMDTAPRQYALSCDSASYVDVLTGFLINRGRSVTLGGLHDCPHKRLPQLISNAAGKQTLAPAVVQELNAGLAQGQKESGKVKAYLDELYDECIQLLPPSKQAYRDCLSLFWAVNNRAVLNFDIVSDRSTLLLRILAEQFQMLVRRGVPLFVILDNLALWEENAMKSLCSVKARGFYCSVVGSDLFALCDGNKALFDSLIGSSQKWFIFQHGSGISAEKWSGAFSTYRKIETTTNISRGYGRNSGLGGSAGGGMFHIGLNWGRSRNGQQGYSYVDKEEAVVRAEEIQRLPRRGGYVYTAADRTIAHISEFLPQ